MNEPAKLLVVAAMPVLHAFDFLAPAGAAAAPDVCAIFGDEPYLKSLVLAELRRTVLAGKDGEFSLTRFDGETAPWREVFDELSTVALFGGGRRLVVVDDADDFVSQNRAALEDYVARPRSTGTLALIVKSWTSTTRLAKAVAASSLAVECKLPTSAKLLTWLVGWARRRHQAKLARDAAELMLEIVGPELGLIDQELAKLAAAAGKEPITAERVEQLVGGWRVKTAWELLDAALAGDAQQALVELDRLLLSGETPIGLLGQLGWSLRRFAMATRLVQQAEAAGRRTALRQALEAAGFKAFKLGEAEAQLRQLGRERAGKLLRWLLEADLALKGPSSSPPRARIVLEQLIARISAPQSRPAAGRTAAR